MTFVAKYPGRCGVCDEQIRPDDSCAYAEDVVVHADCPEPRESAPRPVCDGCFMEQAANGSCGCER